MDARRPRPRSVPPQRSDKYGTLALERYAEAIEVAFNTLRDFRQVADRYEFDDRSSNLSWTHHQVVAGREDRLEWLARAETEGWSVGELRLRTRGGPAAQASENPEVPIDLADAARRWSELATLPADEAAVCRWAVGIAVQAAARRLLREGVHSEPPAYFDAGTDFSLANRYRVFEMRVEREGGRVPHLVRARGRQVVRAAGRASRGLCPRAPQRAVPRATLVPRLGRNRSSRPAPRGVGPFRDVVVRAARTDAAEAASRS